MNKVIVPLVLLVLFTAGCSDSFEGKWVAENEIGCPDSLTFYGENTLTIEDDLTGTIENIEDDFYKFDTRIGLIPFTTVFQIDKLDSDTLLVKGNRKLKSSWHDECKFKKIQ